MPAAKPRRISKRAPASAPIVQLLGAGCHHGVAWYPELWPDRVDEDLALMREAGIGLVRIAEFAWSSIEPVEGRYDWAWLDQAFASCAQAGIAVVLCTPTCTPPRWLSLRHPEILRVDVDGRRFEHGSRGHASHVSAVYRRHCARIVTALAARYGNHPALAGWQIDNELLGDVDGEYGAEAQRAWHAFLKRRYGTIAELNRRWATAVWSETYARFSDVPMSGKTPFGCWTGQQVGRHHASLTTDWGDFISTTTREFQALQLAIIRRRSPRPITHNAIAPNRLLPQDAYADLDLAGTDIYRTADAWWTVVERLDLLRGAKMQADGSTRPYLILETSPGQGGGNVAGQAPHPRGFLAVEAAAMLALGGSAFCYWLWRQQRAGIEHCHGAVISAWGSPSFGWDDVRDAGRMVRRLAPVLTGFPPAPADLAVLHSRRSTISIYRGAQLWSGLQPAKLLQEEIYKPLLERGIWRDQRYESDDLGRYRVLLSPFSPILDSGLLDRIGGWIAAGATWIVGPMSGCRTDDATVPTDAGLGRIDALAGLRTLWSVGMEDAPADHVTLGAQSVSGYCFGFAPVASDCRVLGTYTAGPFAGAAWAVERRIGRGRIVVLGALPKAGLGPVLGDLLADAPVWRCQTSWGTLAIPRGKHREVLIAVNLDGKGGWIDLPGACQDLDGGEELPASRLGLEPYAVRVLRRTGVG